MDMVNPRVEVSSVKLSMTSLMLVEGESSTLTVTVFPADATDKTITWKSSSISVETVSGGTVTGVKEGEAVITASCGGKTAQCAVTVRKQPVAGAVDLGLSVNWATCNLGAAEPAGYGDYYAWGETEPYYNSQDPIVWKSGKTGYNWDSYRWCNGFSNTHYTFTRYCSSKREWYWGGSGTPDGKTDFKDYGYKDDAARQKLGGSWRTPTDAEWAELLDNCTWTWTTQSSMWGYRVTSRMKGFTDKSIFLPAAGCRHDSGLYNTGRDGDYWSSSLNTGFPDDARYLHFSSGGHYRHDSNRCYGHSIRPVSE